MVFVIITGTCSQKIFISDKKMGCFCSPNDEPEIKIFECVPAGDNFDYLRPQGTITLSIDRKYNILLVNIRFDGWYKKSVFVFGQSTLNREIIFCCFGELLCNT